MKLLSSPLTASRARPLLVAFAALAATQAHAQLQDITVFTVPFSRINATAPAQIDARCLLYAGSRLVSMGSQTVSVAAGETSGSIRVNMHWPDHVNPDRINSFHCRVLDVTRGRPAETLPTPQSPGLFPIPHAQLSSVQSGSWPR
jgi:hypothetical protein